MYESGTSIQAVQDTVWGKLKDQGRTQTKMFSRGSYIKVHMSHKPVALPRSVAISITFRVASALKNSLHSPVKKYNTLEKHRLMMNEINIRNLGNVPHFQFYKA